MTTDRTAESRKGSRPKNSKANADRKPQFRFGIGEWYGKSFAEMTGDERREYAAIQLIPKERRPTQLCPFLSRPGSPMNCHKEGGVCSLRSYERSRATLYCLDDLEHLTMVKLGMGIKALTGDCIRWIDEESCIGAIGIVMNKFDAIALNEGYILACMKDALNALSKSIGVPA